MVYRILFIGDSPAVSRFVETSIGQFLEEVEFTKCANSVEGLKKASDLSPALILINAPLPDSSVEEFALQLGRDVRTGLIPIVLFYSEGFESGKVQGQCPNLVEVLQKPFSSEQLEVVVRATLRSPDVVRKIHEGRRSGAISSAGLQAPKLLFRAPRELFEPSRILAWIAEGEKSGILRFRAGRQPVEWFFKSGQPLFLSTRDIAFYSADAPIRLEGVTPEILATAAKGQMDSGAPSFLLLSHRGALPLEQAVSSMREYGIRLLAKTLQLPGLLMEFEEADPLPEMARSVEPDERGAVSVLLAALRLIPMQNSANHYDPAGLVRFVAHTDILSRLPELDEAETAWIHAALEEPHLEQLSSKGTWNWPNCAAMVERMTALGVFAYVPPGNEEA